MITVISRVLNSEEQLTVFVYGMAGMVSLQCNNCVIHSLPERFRGELLTIGRYTNLSSFLPLIVCDRSSFIAF